MQTISAVPLTREAFAPFGSVIETDGANSFPINNGNTERFHALAEAQTGEGKAIISIFRGQPFTSPVPVNLMERHPLGSQAFFPLQDRPWLVVVAPDEEGVPGDLQAFLASGRQGVQYAANVWHRPLVSLDVVGDFLVVDRDGPGDNLEECVLDEELLVIV